jgi:dsRNA-specific ribonuclease
VPALAIVSTGTGTNRRAAEQDAAAQAFARAVVATDGMQGG